MKKILLVALAAMVVVDLCAQHEADTWYFGSNAGITFAGGNPAFLPGGQLNTQEGCASLSDHNGNLLFYSSGQTIWSRDHLVMPNGNSLNSSSTCTEAALFTPYPDHDSLFYLFTPPDQFDQPSRFCYSIVDLTLNGGFGDVIDKNTPLFSPSTEKATAVRHANGNDIWVIAHGFGNADFYAYLITSAGIDTVPVISTAGTIHTGSILNKIGVMKVSPCGDKIGLTVFGDAFVELFDFDDQTGIVSNPVHLADYPLFNQWGIYGAEFSPNGSRFYVTQENPALLVQYDLLAGSPGAIIASADTIYFNNSSFGTLQNGPDKRIYVSRLGNRLGRINAPDQLGAACNFVDSVISLEPVMGFHGLPNFMTSYFCEHSPTSGLSSPDMDLSFVMGPNPANDLVRIGFQSASTVRVDLIDALGRPVLRKTCLPIGGRTEVAIPLEHLPSGVYFVQISDGRSTRVEKLVKE